MARAGIYKSEVVRARDRLLAQGRYPSIDAVRVELGNTGSKATIHRYLKEIEEEEGSRGDSKVTMSDALQDLVARLASRLQDEADAKLAEAQQVLNGERQQYESRAAIARQEADNLRQQLERTEVLAGERQRELVELRGQVEAGRVECSQLKQHVADLQERLSVEAQHRESLEEKHKQAREALDHFRNATKEQREQTQRQHDQQLQYLQGELRTLNQTLTNKQEELTLSHRDNGRLTTEVARLQTDLHQAHGELRAFKRTQEHLVASERKATALEERIEALQAAHARLTVDHETLQQQLRDVSVRLQQREMDLFNKQAATDAQAQVLEALKGHLGELTNRPTRSASR